MYKVKNSFFGGDAFAECNGIAIQKGNEAVLAVIECPDSARNKKGYQFGSREFNNTSQKLSDALNGKWFKLPFGFRLIKIK